MSDSKLKSLLLLPGDKKAVEASERHKRAREIVDLIFALEPGTPRRWQAIWNLWITMRPITHYREHKLTIQENKEIRASLLDKRFGQSAATLNKGRVLETGKQVQHLRVLGNMPASLYDMLKRYDPLGLGMATGKEAQKMKVRLYNTFPQYKLPEHI